MFSNNHKKTLMVLLCILVALVGFIGVFHGSALAQENPPFSSTSSLGYTPLQDIGVDLGEDFSLADYLNAMFRIFLGVASILAVVMIVFAGVQYGTSSSEAGTKAAKERMTNALWGLLLALGAWLILFTINPQLLEFNLSLEPIEGTGVSTGKPPVGGDPGDPWQSDSIVRTELAEEGIYVNKSNCERVGQTNCTSLTGMNQSAFRGLVSIKKECEIALGRSCSITITGGTEYWLHKTHGPGNIFDLRSNRDINDFVNPEGRELGCFEKIGFLGATFQWEGAECEGSTGDHWHVIF